MRIAFCLFKYFPYGGLQRDFLRIARAMSERGHQVRVYTLSWEGPGHDDFQLFQVPVRALSHHRLYEKYQQWVHEHLAKEPADVVVGFDKMAGLDIYYGAECCYEEKMRKQCLPWHRWTPRYYSFRRRESAVFSPGASTRILFLSERTRRVCLLFYGTPPERTHLLPPGIEADRRRPAEEEAQAIRKDLRREFHICEDDFLLLLVGSGFHTKGLDRALRALRALPGNLRTRTQLLAIGQDKSNRYWRLARRLNIASNFQILPGRDDILRFLLGADLLLHPARRENTGAVLLEAITAGLPVITTDACGYAAHIKTANAGVGIPSPFQQEQLNAEIAMALNNPKQRRQWQQNALRYASRTPMQGLVEEAVRYIETAA